MITLRMGSYAAPWAATHLHSCHPKLLVTGMSVPTIMLLVPASPSSSALVYAISTETLGSIRVLRQIATLSMDTSYGPHN